MTPCTLPAAGAALPRRGNHARRAVWLLYGLTGAFLLVYLGFLVIRRPDQSSTLLDGWLVAGFEILASVLCLTRGLLWRRGRGVALALGASLLSWSIGDVALTAESLGGATPATPSVADAFYLAFFPLAYVAVVLFMRGEVRRLTTPSWLDSAVAGLGAAAVCAAFAFQNIMHLAGEGALAVATNLAYPVGDVLLLLLAVAGTAMLSGRRKAPWLLLGSGIALNVVGDTFNLFGSTVGATHVGSTINGIAWPTAILLMSIAVWIRPGYSDPLALQKPPGFVLPGVAAVAGLAILVFGTVRHVDTVAVGLATAALVAVGIRLALSVRGLRTLTQERQSESVTDDLTGLRNRRYLFHILDAFFAEEAATPIPDPRLAFMFVDLKHFKEINDSFGHPTGDEVLRQLGARLTSSLRGSDLLVRLGGDEFAIVLMDADADEAKRMARRLAASLQEPFVVEGVSMRIGASIGIALAPTDATDANRLVWCADVAMYRAKLGDSPFALYEQELDEGGDRLRLAEELRTAVDAGKLVLHYQPQLDLRSGEILAVEALVRWPHPRLGVVPPLKFLPLAEDAGLMGALTTWVLGQSLGQCAAWRAAGRRMAVSVNVSATNLLEAGFTERVRGLLERHGLPGDALVLEITETSIISEFERSKMVIAELRDLGLVISIDDFGTGFTSIAYLGSLAVGELKLDRTLIASLAAGQSGRDLRLVRATVDLGHALGMRVVAEGIEDLETLEVVSGIGCDLGQGYLIGKPRAANELAFRSQSPTRRNRHLSRRIHLPYQRHGLKAKGPLARDSAST
jgi:diguanylate cyclase